MADESDHHSDTDEVYALAGDESIVIKADKGTERLDRFLSSLNEKAMPGTPFFDQALISTARIRCFSNSGCGVKRRR
ncbi:MAG: hypothetical protein KJ065_05105 [Anaerolineae bacterium]|nr:hypothetical protein [Anaerolineae bacterium]